MGIWIWFFINVPIVTYINGTGVISNNLFPGVYYAVASGFVHALYFATLSLSYAIGPPFSFLTTIPSLHLVCLIIQ